ncbi:ribonuclease H-like domain-containing protein [Tanacetum coccineum]
MARLVTSGSSQQFGVNVDETFSPVIKLTTIHIALNFSISRHWSIHHLDVKNAFLHGSLFETLYMHKSPSSQDPQHLVLLVSTNVFLWSEASFSGMGLEKYAYDVLKCAHMLNYNPFHTLVDTNYMLGAYGYQVEDPTLASFFGSKTDFAYVRGTMSYHLQLFSASTSSLVAYSDADWAGSPTTRRSTYGYCVFLGNNLLS